MRFALIISLLGNILKDLIVVSRRQSCFFFVVKTTQKDGIALTFKFYNVVIFSVVNYLVVALKIFRCNFKNDPIFFTRQTVQLLPHRLLPVVLDEPKSHCVTTQIVEQNSEQKYGDRFFH